MHRISFSLRAAVRYAALLGAVFVGLLVSQGEVQAVSKFFVPPAAGSGDYDGNSGVDGNDVMKWQQQLGSSMDISADGDGSGTVDAGDLVVWKNQLGSAVSGPTGDWENPNFWNPAGLPGQLDGVFVHANRTANLSSNVGNVSEIRIGDTYDPPGGTLNINAGGKLTCLGEVLMGASNPGFQKEGHLNLNGGTLVTYGTFFLAFEPDSDETLTVRPGSLLDVNQNMFGRFGNATVNQTGGVVDIQNNLVWGEGGDDDGIGVPVMSRSEYNLSGGDLKIGQALAIGGDTVSPRPASNGRLNVSGGMVTADDLVFDVYPGEEATLSISGSGIARFNQANYTIADANADILGGSIIGEMLVVSTVNVGGTDYTQIISTAGLGIAVNAIPEPTAAALLVLALPPIVRSGGQGRRNDCGTNRAT